MNLEVESHAVKPYDVDLLCSLSEYTVSPGGRPTKTTTME